jgi:hypothetical protein
MFRSWLLVVCAVLAVAVWLRFDDLAKPSLWDDEMHTVVFAERPLPVMWQQSAHKDSNPLGFYLLLHGWLSQGESEWHYRALPAAFGVLAVAAFFWLGAAWYGPRTGCLTALLAAAHPLSVYCSREVRAHTAALAAVVLGTAFLARLWQTGRVRHAIGYGLSMAAALHLHYYAFLVLGAHFLVGAVRALVTAKQAWRAAPSLAALWFSTARQCNPAARHSEALQFAAALDEWRTRARGLLLWLAAWLGAVVLFLPFCKVFAFQLLRGQSWRVPAQPAAALTKSWLYFAFAATPDLPPTFGWPPDAFTLSWRLALLLALAGVPMLAALLAGLRDREFSASRNGLTGLAFAGFALLAVALRVQPVFDVRHLLLLMPPLLVLTARGLERLFQRGRVVGGAATLAALAPMLLAVHQERTDPAYARQDWRTAAQQVCSQQRPGDLALAYHEEKAYAFAHYARACGLPVRVLFDDQALALDLDERRNRLRRGLGELTANASRVWLVDYHGAVFDPLGEAAQELAQGGFHRIQHVAYDRSVKRFTVSLFTRDAAEALASFAPAVDLTGPHNPAQLVAGWYPPGEKGAWTAARAVVRLKRTDQQRVEAIVYVHRPFYDGPVTLRLLWQGDSLAVQTVTETQLVTLSGELPETTPRDALLDLTLETDRTFIPADVLATPDRTVKGVLVQRVALK